MSSREVSYSLARVTKPAGRRSEDRAQIYVSLGNHWPWLSQLPSFSCYSHSRLPTLLNSHLSAISRSQEANVPSLNVLSELSLKRKRKDDHCPEGPSLAQCSIIHKATQPKTASVQPLVVRRHAFARLVQDTLDNIHTPAEGWDEAKEMD